MKSREVRERKLQRLCDEWQKRLRLEDWKVTVNLAPSEVASGVWGSIIPSTQQKRACLTVRDMRLNPAPQLADQDPEVTVVHELLHLQYDGFEHLIKKDANKAEHTLMEQSINLIAEALVALRREAKS